MRTSHTEKKIEIVRLWIFFLHAAKRFFIHELWFSSDLGYTHPYL